MQLQSQGDFKSVRNLPFCYVCGLQFYPEDECDSDHVPPQTIFAKLDRQPLKLKTHKRCNERHSGDDQNFGQLIGASEGRAPSDPKNFRLKITPISSGVGGISNLNVDAAIFRWVMGCHAALYREYIGTKEYSVVSPFPRADQIDGGPFRLRHLLPQHPLFVETIKTQRMHDELDRIATNRGKFVYECVWGQLDRGTGWICMFAINLYDWKTLGQTPIGPQRGCAGCYSLPNLPRGATTVKDWKIVHPNLDPLDPFGR